jgi:hypothetical protein
MKDVDVLPLTVDLVGSFFRSSRDALERALRAKATQKVREPTGLNMFTHRRDETQAALESLVFSFLTIEATINYVFFCEQRSRPLNEMDRWLRDKWKRYLRVYDRFVLLIAHYSSDRLDKFQSIVTLLSEFITFRNRIVHAHPEEYDALVELGDEPDEVRVHDVQRMSQTKAFPRSGLSEEIGRIDSHDASRAFEIMLVVVAFLDEQFVSELELPWTADLAGGSQRQYMRPSAILGAMDHREYPGIDPASLEPIGNYRGKRKREKAIPML